jgi:hypothetical protein
VHLAQGRDDLLAERLRVGTLRGRMLITDIGRAVIGISQVIAVQLALVCGAKAGKSG